MNIDYKAGQPEGEALSTFQSAAKAPEKTGAVAAVERWYAKHFHKATLAGVAPISAEDKASLIAHVQAATNPVKE